MVNLLLEQVQVGGANPITLDSIRRLISEAVGNLHANSFAEIRDSIRNLSEQQIYGFQQQGVNLNNANNNNHNNIVNNNNNKLCPRNKPFRWPGRENFFSVPFGFKWPSYNISTIWILWHFGNPNSGIGPYKLILRNLDLADINCKVNQTRCKKVMDTLINIAIEEGKIQRAINSITRGKEIYDHVMAILINRLYPDSHERPEDLNINANII